MIVGVLISSVAIIAALKVYKHNILKIDYDKRQEPQILENIEEIFEYETPAPVPTTIDSTTSTIQQPTASSSAKFKNDNDRFDDND